MEDEEQFRVIFDFLAQHDWIYNFQVTKFFCQKVWQKIPEEWVPCLLKLTLSELNQLPYGMHGCETSKLPESLSSFINTCLRFSIDRSQCNSLKPVTLDPSMRRGMNPKKEHEVTFLAGLIHEQATLAGCDVIVDVGSGLGYLDRVLCSHYGYKVIGLECDSGRTHSANRRAEKQACQGQEIKHLTFELKDDCNSMMQFEKLVYSTIFGQDTVELCDNEGTASSDSQTIESDPEKALTSFMSETAVHGNLKICMVGLHCCGDLTPTMLKYFTKLDCIRSICCVSCCYHKMSVQDERFRYFPLSQKCSSALKASNDRHPSFNINVFGMRLAAQETRSRWQMQTVIQHERHQKNVAYRAILELYLDKYGLSHEKLFRKMVWQPDIVSFEQYVECLMQRIKLSGSPDEVDMKKDMMSLFDDNMKFLHYIEPITALQVLLQPVLETLIYYDRQEFLKEKGYEAVCLPVFHEDVSPRNLALVTNKVVDDSYRN